MFLLVSQTLKDCRHLLRQLYSLRKKTPKTHRHLCYFWEIERKRHAKMGSVGSFIGDFDLGLKHQISINSLNLKCACIMRIQAQISLKETTCF